MNSVQRCWATFTHRQIPNTRHNCSIHNSDGQVKCLLETYHLLSKTCMILQFAAYWDRDNETANQDKVMMIKIRVAVAIWVIWSIMINLCQLAVISSAVDCQHFMLHLYVL